MSTSHPNVQRLLAACGVVLALTACASDESERRESPQAGQQGQQRAGDAAFLSAPQIVGVARAINEGEVELATAVQARLTDPGARRFAEMMIREHGAANERLSALSRELALAPEDSALRQELVRESQQVTRRLNAAPAGDVDEEYLESQVEQHHRALDVIDNRLLSAAREERLRQELTAMRGLVAAHLTEAEQLRSK